MEAADGHVYRKNGAAWDVVTTQPTASRWSLDEWGDLVYATTRGQILQKWTPPDNLLDATPQFEDVIGAPTGALVVRKVRDFLALFNFGENGVQLVQWSGLNFPDEWMEGVKLSDFQELRDVGEILDVVTYEDAYLLCTKGIVRMSLADADFVFQFDPVTREYGVEASGMAVAIDRSIYFGSTAGFVRLRIDTAVPEPIGEGRIDSTFRRLMEEGGTNGVFTFYDSVRKSIRWGFPSRQGQYPDATLIYSMESRSWGQDVSEHPVLFVESSPDLTWAASANKWGNTIGEIFDVLKSYEDPRIEGGIEIPHGFTEELKAGPLTNRHAESVITTNLFSPLLDGMERAMVTEIRPWTDGRPQVSIATHEVPNRGHVSAHFEDTEEMLETGAAPAFHSGRYIQIRFTFYQGDNFTYISGFDIDFERDGEL